LTHVNSRTKVTHMEKTQIYFRQEELAALREAAARSGRSIAELVRDAVRKVVLKQPAAGPVAIWNGRPERISVEHDSVHDKP
jgi:Ribbon-helix-helix protein, copG family